MEPTTLLRVSTLLCAGRHSRAGGNPASQQLTQHDLRLTHVAPTRTECFSANRLDSRLRGNDVLQIGCVNLHWMRKVSLDA